VTTRHLIAYGLIAGLAAAAFVALWFAVLRQSLSRRRSRIRFERSRAAASAARELARETGA
jgi:hypothetical protein